MHALFNNKESAVSSQSLYKYKPKVWCWNHEKAIMQFKSNKPISSVTTQWLVMLTQVKSFYSISWNRFQLDFDHFYYVLKLLVIIIRMKVLCIPQFIAVYGKIFSFKEIRLWNEFEVKNRLLYEFSIDSCMLYDHICIYTWMATIV